MPFQMIKYIKRLQEKVEISDHDKLIKYAEDLGFVIQTTKGISEINWSWHNRKRNKPSYIDVDVTRKPMHQYYELLHELGHHELRCDWKVYKTNYPAQHLAIMMDRHSKYRSRVGFGIESLQEEFDAWTAGLVIADRLGLAVNRPAYKAYSKTLLSSYVKYYGTLLCANSNSLVVIRDL